MATKAISQKNNFNTKHLKRGDPLPPYNGKLRIYNMRFCPFAHRTILALNAKKIDYEIININLVDKPEWYTRKSTFGKVPALEIKEDVCVYESLITVEYLDEVYPQRPLLPKDPLRKAIDRIIIEASGPLHTLLVKIVPKTPELLNEATLEAYQKALEFIQDQLQDRGTKFLSGNDPGYVDYMIWPWFERINSLKMIDQRAEINPSKFKLLLEYIRNMYKDPAVSVYLTPDDIMYKFFSSYRTGSPNYALFPEEYSCGTNKHSDNDCEDAYKFAGDPLPPYNGKLRVYNMRFCPYAQRTILALNAKQIDYEIINIHLVDKPEWLTRKSAFGKVPALEIKEDVCIYESLITVEYLDEVYPQRPLLPKDPLRKAIDKIIIEASAPLHTLLMRIVKTPDVSREKTLVAYEKALEFIQDQLQSRGTKFLGGNDPGYVDYMIWPWFERINSLKMIDQRAEINPSKFKRLLEYIRNMYKDPAVSVYLTPDDIMFKFFSSYRTGAPDYALIPKD